jgi:hypothetical protein
MSSGVSSLPRDPDILIEMIAGLRAENEKLRAMLETLKRTLYGARSENPLPMRRKWRSDWVICQHFRSSPNRRPRRR